VYNFWEKCVQVLLEPK